MPDPFTADDHVAGYTFQLSILQAELSRTRVFDRPLAGRHLFKAVTRENLDLGGCPTCPIQVGKPPKAVHKIITHQ